MQSAPTTASSDNVTTIGLAGALLPKTDTSALSQRAQRFTTHFVASRPALHAYLSTFLRNRESIEDCLQEVAVTVWNKYNDNWDAEEFRRFAFTCSRYKALSWMKKNKPNTLLFFDPEVTAEIAERVSKIVEDSADLSADRMRALAGCIETLPESHQDVIRARYRYDERHSLSEVAAAQSRSLPAVYKLLERLRGLLKKCMEQHLREDQ